MLPFLAHGFDSAFPRPQQKDFDSEEFKNKTYGIPREMESIPMTSSAVYDYPDEFGRGPHPSMDSNGSHRDMHPAESLNDRDAHVADGSHDMIIPRSSQVIIFFFFVI